MPANEANPIYLSERERRDLEALVRQQTCAQIVLLASEGVGIQPSATRLGIRPHNGSQLSAALAREHRQPCRRMLG